MIVPSGVNHYNVMVDNVDVFRPVCDCFHTSDEDHLCTLFGVPLPTPLPLLTKSSHTRPVGDVSPESEFAAVMCIVSSQADERETRETFPGNKFT